KGANRLRRDSAEIRTLDRRSSVLAPRETRAAIIHGRPPPPGEAGQLFACPASKRLRFVPADSDHRMLRFSLWKASAGPTSRPGNTRSIDEGGECCCARQSLARHAHLFAPELHVRVTPSQNELMKTCIGY